MNLNLDDLALILYSKNKILLILFTRESLLTNFNKMNLLFWQEFFIFQKKKMHHQNKKRIFDRRSSFFRTLNKI